MIIQKMFKDDINRPINGVIQVEQKEEDIVEQEIREYVVTNELKRHISQFFNYYSNSFEHPTDNTGVWITGFFGSGKSHFLKMLSYLLENKEIKGNKTVELFRKKFDDELAFMPIQNATSVPTETILFNIDVEGPMKKDSTAVLQVFAKVFYDHLGFYGNDLKVAKLEQFITKKGKMEEFKRAFEEINGDSWINSRDSFAFFEDDIVECLVNVLGMSKEAAQHWFDGTETVDISIGQLVDEIKEYVDSKPKNFRLLFMIDEAGQYIGTHTDMLLNLQTLIEKLGSACHSQVWVVATGQEALDEMIKVREDEFSRIMARFAVRLSLTSSSVGEVIEKRLLTKEKDAEKILEKVYDNNDAVLRNLYSFVTDKKDIRGYRSSDEFVRQFPFVPYQFLVMQNIYNEIRKHGHTGKHQSQGERSMLNGFQESAQSVQNRDELSVVPLFAFYDTLHSSLDTSIRSVVERAEKAAEDGFGIEDDDVKLLKLLYLIRYVDDIPSNIENLTILMAEKIDTDKLELKEKVKESLDRLIKQNYVSRNGDLYMFLTDEEQDVEREIKNTPVDSATVINEIGSQIFDDIYSFKKYRYDNIHDYEFNSYVDGQSRGVTKENNISLKFYSAAADAYNTTEQRLLMDSGNNMAICVLTSDNPYYNNLEYAAKIRKYTKQKNINQLAPTLQRIIQDKQSEASRLEKEAREEIKKAIVNGAWYAQGEKLNLAGTDAANKINQALKYLIEHTYTKLNYVDETYNTDQEINQILLGQAVSIDGIEPNKQACADVLDFLDARKTMNMTVTMYDIQSRYSAIPYGWREADIAGVVARLIYDQKVTVKVAGQVVPTNDYRLVGYLRKKSEVGNAVVAKRDKINHVKLKNAKDFLREYFNIMDLPDDEDGLFNKIVLDFTEKKSDFDKRLAENSHRHYPGYDTILKGSELVNEVLKTKTDGVALIDKINEVSDDLLDNKDDMTSVDNFYRTQRTLFDDATKFCNETSGSIDYFQNYPQVEEALNKIKAIITYKDNYNYSQIKDLNGLMSTIKTVKIELVQKKREEVKDVIDQCFAALETKAKADLSKAGNILNQARIKFDNRKNEIDEIDDLLVLDARKSQTWTDKGTYEQLIDEKLAPATVSPVNPVDPPKRVVKKYRNVILQQKKLRSNSDIDAYVDELRRNLYELLKNNDEIDIE
ncbi:MAG: BREX system P-loop protein BrxC [Erysipelotrichaceae bacterium]|nr:BREX system P-loop protein BrxC [Erysipelotrichaceae bacterium]